MLMTEDEARSKWCPFSRAALMQLSDGDTKSVPTGLPSFNRFALDSNRPSPLTSPPACGCLASRCMAWRVEQTIETAQQTERPDGDGWYRDPMSRLPEIWWRRRVNAGGYCGLAGKP